MNFYLVNLSCDLGLGEKRASHCHSRFYIHVMIVCQIIVTVKTHANSFPKYSSICYLIVYFKPPEQ